jgi:predicted nucleic acid-binding protein
MEASRPPKPRVFIDADVLFAASASPSAYGAALMVLRMAEITLIEAIASEQVIVESKRNLQEKIPSAIPAFQMIISRCLRVVADPSQHELIPLKGTADPKDLPILAVAQREQCAYLVTFNIRHYQPGVAQIKVLRPGEFVLQVRYLLSRLT